MRDCVFHLYFFYNLKSIFSVTELIQWMVPNTWSPWSPSSRSSRSSSWHPPWYPPWRALGSQRHRKRHRLKSGVETWTTSGPTKSHLEHSIAVRWKIYRRFSEHSAKGFCESNLEAKTKQIKINRHPHTTLTHTYITYIHTYI